MALAASAGCVVLVFSLFLITVALGSHVLEIAGLTVDHPLDAVLYSTGIGFAILQLLLGIVGFVAGLTVRSVIVLLVLLAIAGGRGWKSLFRLCQASAKDFSGVFQSVAARALGFCILFFVILEALLSTAPLTGSDAMAYHFTVPLLQIGRPEQPLFWLTTSFYIGLGHELIALGLVLGGDRLALLLIFFGGCLTAGALFQMARKWMAVEWALAAALTFLMTPMVFWQISTAGSPDIWMGFYTVLAALAVGQADAGSKRPWLLLASVYAGAGASLKYTGWIVPAVIILFVLWLTRSILWAAVCSATALAIGAFPLLRNFLWTGDPFFPFLTRWIGKVPFNEFGLASLQKAAHSGGFSTQPFRILYFLGAMTLRGADYGVGHYFGPIVLAFFPLLIFCNWRSRLVWVAAALCGGMLLANAFTSQTARYLLPAFPLVLGLAFFGAAAASREAGGSVRFGCAATLALFGIFCLASDTLYAKPFLPVTLGLESKAAFLNRMAPDYQSTLFVNSAMAQREGKALVFFRHVYYLRVPYENGDPITSWMVNPAVLTDPQTLHAFLKEQGIRWVVKSPNYPMELAAIFEECEKEGLLVPEARTEIQTLSGDSRVYNLRITVPVTLLRVAP